MRRASGRIAPTGGGSRPMAEFRDLLLPGGQHAGEALDPEAFLDSLLRVERAWVMAQTETGILDSGWAEQVAAALGAARDYDLPGLAAEAEAGGNPVIGLVGAVRQRVRDRLGATEFPDGADSDPGAAVHRGLTSQDVMDTALMLRMRAGTERILAEVTAAGDALAEIAQQQARTPMIARTLAQHALPTTFGARAGGWLDGLGQARAELSASLRGLPVAIGGAAGTGVQLPRPPGGPRDPQALLAAWARRLGLVLPAAPWHTRRHPVIAAAQAPALTAQCFARIGGDVVVSARREMGELSEPAAPGRGGSSAMAHKRNPVLSVLMRRSGLAAASAMGRLAARVRRAGPGGALGGGMAPGVGAAARGPGPRDDRRRPGAPSPAGPGGPPRGDGPQPRPDLPRGHRHRPGGHRDLRRRRKPGPGRRPPMAPRHRPG